MVKILHFDFNPQNYRYRLRMGIIILSFQSTEMFFLMQEKATFHASP